MYERLRQHLFQELHQEHGQSGLASSLGYEVVSSLDHKQFTDPKLMEDVVDLARITVVTATSAIKNALTWSEAQPHLIHAFEILTQLYPYATSLVRADTKGEYWSQAYNGAGGNTAGLYDTVNFLDLAYPVSRDQSLKDLQGGFIQIQQALSQQEGADRFILIHQIRRAPYPVAVEKYSRFVKKFGPQHKSSMPDQIITVSSIMAGRAIEYLDSVQLGRGLASIVIAAKKDPSQWRFAIRELARNIPRTQAESKSQNKILSWQDAYQKNNQAMALHVERFKQIRYVGLGNNRVAKFNRRQP